MDLSVILVWESRTGSMKKLDRLKPILRSIGTSSSWASDRTVGEVVAVLHMASEVLVRSVGSGYGLSPT